MSQSSTAPTAAHLEDVGLTQIWTKFLGVIRNHSPADSLPPPRPTFTLVVLGSIAVLQFDKTPEGNIKNAHDALWWAFTTIATVGYGVWY